MQYYLVPIISFTVNIVLIEIFEGKRPLARPSCRWT